LAFIYSTVAALQIWQYTVVFTFEDVLFLNNFKKN
jgi:hypothetical protein